MTYETAEKICERMYDFNIEAIEDDCFVGRWVICFDDDTEIITHKDLSFEDVFEYLIYFIDRDDVLCFYPEWSMRKK